MFDDGAAEPGRVIRQMVLDPVMCGSGDRPKQIDRSAADSSKSTHMASSSLAGEKDAQRARGGETKMPLRRAARPLVLLSIEPHPPLSRGWHRALASGPVAGSAFYTLHSGCDVCSAYRTRKATVN